MVNTIDARGLSCPQPVLVTLKEIDARKNGEFVVLVDNETAKENVGRAVISKGWKLKTIQTDGNEYHLTIFKE